MFPFFIDLEPDSPTRKFQLFGLLMISINTQQKQYCFVPLVPTASLLSSGYSSLHSMHLPLVNFCIQGDVIVSLTVRHSGMLLLPGNQDSHSDNMVTDASGLSPDHGDQFRKVYMTQFIPMRPTPNENLGIVRARWRTVHENPCVHHHRDRPRVT